VCVCVCVCAVCGCDETPVCVPCVGADEDEDGHAPRP
jgi:hypothetical protein